MPNYTEQNTGPFKPKLPTDAEKLSELRQRNNPDNMPVGDWTGRCGHCGSSDLRDDNLAYGCNSCSAMLGGNK